MASNKPKFAPDEVVEVVETHAVALPDNPFGEVLIAGTRLRGNHPAVLGNPQFFAVSGTPHDEISVQLHELHAVERQPEPEYVRTRVLPPLRDEDAVVPCRPVVGVPAGRRLPKDDPAVLQQPDSFVDVVGEGRTRENSYQALATLTHTANDGTVSEVYQGQWIAKDDPAVARHPQQFAMVAEAALST